MHDLRALKVFYGQAGASGYGGDETELETAFDGLVSVDFLDVRGNSLTRVPSMKNLGMMTQCGLEQNAITMIAPGDFAGAVSLVALSLGGNDINSVAPEAFLNLAALTVLPEEFNPQKDGKPYTSSIGYPLWTETGHGSFGGNKIWSTAPISFAPNPVECKWIGPNLTHFDCSRCVLGYETTNTDNATTVDTKWTCASSKSEASCPKGYEPTGKKEHEAVARGLEGNLTRCNNQTDHYECQRVTCVKPVEFGPHKGWAASAERAQLTLNDKQTGIQIERNTDTNASIILVGHTYSTTNSIDGGCFRRFLVVPLNGTAQYWLFRARN